MKKSIQIFLELGSYIFVSMWLCLLFMVIEEFPFSRNLSPKYNLCALFIDVLQTWFAIFIILPWFTRLEDFDPETKHKFEAIFFTIVLLNSFWVSGPWRLCR